jgi:hypothetical protein
LVLGATGSTGGVDQNDEATPWDREFLDRFKASYGRRPECVVHGRSTERRARTTLGTIREHAHIGTSGVLAEPRY